VAPTPARHPLPSPPAKPAADTRARHRRERHSDVAEDQVVIHHYGERKHPAASGTRAGIRQFSDQ
jgi:hypothetical protein